MKAGIKDCAKTYAKIANCSLTEAEKSMKIAVEVISEQLTTTGGVAFMGVLSLEVVQRKEKNGINPSTKQPCVIPAHKAVKLTVGKQLKEELNK